MLEDSEKERSGPGKESPKLAKNSHSIGYISGLRQSLWETEKGPVPVTDSIDYADGETSSLFERPSAFGHAASYTSGYRQIVYVLRDHGSVSHPEKRDTDYSTVPPLCQSIETRLGRNKAHVRKTERPKAEVHPSER